MALEPLTPERRRAQTRRHLLDAAAIVFARNGFHGSTLDEVAATAGFTKGAVYSNFASKDDLFLALLEDRMERQIALFQTTVAEAPSEAEEQSPHIRTLIDHIMFDMFDDEMSALYLEFVLYARRNPAAREKLVASVRHSREAIREMTEWIYARDGLTPPFPLAPVAIITSAMFSGLSTERLIDPAAIDDDVIDTTLAMLYSALAVNGPGD